MADPRLARPLWRGRRNVDALTISAIERAEKQAGHTFTVTQGSYQSSVAASAGTHDRGGAVDLRWCGHDACLLALRRCGLWSWHRTPAQGPWPDHIHGVIVGHPDLAPAAARQVEAARRGENGLANGRPDDGPYTLVVAPVWPVAKPKPTRGARITAAIKALRAEKAAAKGKPVRLRRVKAALRELRQVKPK